MTRTIYHFTFRANVCLDAVEDALLLAVLAAEALHGAGRDAPDVVHLPADAPRTYVIDARTKAGNAVLRVFFAYVFRMFGPRAFRVVTAEDLGERTGRRRKPVQRCACGRDGARR